MSELKLEYERIKMSFTSASQNSALPEGWEVVRLGDVAEMIMNPENKKPRINADERRYGINNELGRTDTNSGHSELVRVRFSSLLISVLRLLFAPAHGRAAASCACRSSAVEPRGGDEREGRQDDED